MHPDLPVRTRPSRAQFTLGDSRTQVEVRFTAGTLAHADKIASSLGVVIWSATFNDEANTYNVVARKYVLL